MKRRQISTNHKANRQMRVGATARVMLVGAIAVGFAACQSPKTLSVAGQKQGVNGVREQKSRNGTLINTLTGHTSDVSRVSFSPDGQTIASGSSDKTIKLWKRDGKALATLRGHTYPVMGVSFSPDGQTIASGDLNNTVKLC